MQIRVIHQNITDPQYTKIWSSDSHPVPRIGERVDLGFKPAPVVKEVIHRDTEIIVAVE